MKGNISLRAIKTWLYIRITNKHYLTRGIHIVLVVTTLITLYFASTFTLQTTTKQILNTSLENYEELRVRYSDTLQCPCVQISIPYKSFMNITVLSRHQVCSSPFITERWISTLPLPKPQKGHSLIDFNKTAIGFFQLLTSLCELSERHLTDEISDLMRKSLISTHVISRLQFSEQIQSIIDQFEQNIPFSFLTTLQMIRAMISDNHLMTVFETNWQWMEPSLNHPDYWGLKLHTKPIVYNSSCNCGLSSECVQESSMKSGLMVGCYPLESLLKSTLECLYNVSCFSLLQYVSQSFAPLNDSHPSRFQKNSTVKSILDQLMIEQWNNNINYEKYYNECSPSFCSYSYIERNHTLQVLTLLLGLYGGLTIIMNVVALLIGALWHKILIKYQRRHVQVQPM
jgi:hypothetical protein